MAPPGYWPPPRRRLNLRALMVLCVVINLATAGFAAANGAIALTVITLCLAGMSLTLATSKRRP